MERKYIAFGKDGYGNYEEIVYWSYHRANSKANFEDAVKEYRRKHGYYIKHITFTTSRLAGSEE